MPPLLKEFSGAAGGIIPPNVVLSVYRPARMDSGEGSVQREDVGVFDRAAEDVEGAADGQIDAASAHVVNAPQIVEALGAARVGGWYGRETSQAFNELVVNALAFAFDVDGVD